MKLLATFVSVFFSFYSFSRAFQEEQVQCKKIQIEWYELDLNLIKNCVGFSAPVAARTLYYVSVSCYESVVEILPENNSLSEQLNGYKRETWAKDQDELFFPHVANTVNYKITKYLFENMPPYELKKVEDLYSKLRIQYSKGITRKGLLKAEIYANSIAEEIIALSKKDGGDKGYTRNFPSSYQPPQCQSCWTKTYPGYKPALLPFWGQNELSLMSNRINEIQINPLPFSTDPNSQYYQDASELSEFYLALNTENEIVSEYWDDGPGISCTPAGHLYQIALNLCKDSKCDLQKMVEFFATLGIAINDAMIETWRLKYMYNLIRPISYIQQYIRSDFNTIIETPSFPEFPSGHSVQAGVSCEILINFFTDDIPIVDSTNVYRTDIKGFARKYKSFTDMANEMSISRFYGGIHYSSTLEESLKIGKLIGVNTLKQLKLRK